MPPSAPPLRLTAEDVAFSRLASFAALMSPDTPPAAHHRLLCRKLEAVERGEIKRLMIFMPPGGAKSHYANVMFGAWYVGRNPRKTLLTCSASGSLAEQWGRRVRNIVGTAEFRAIFGVGLSGDNQAADRWGTDKGGEYKAAGVTANIVGRRADLGVLDDPVADREAADSQTRRDKLWAWYKTDFWTRLKPGAAVILIMTRWHEDDLAGRLLRDMENGGERWEVLSLPAVADSPDDPLGRTVGEALWPEWFTPEMFRQAKRDPRTWSALYQQKPTVEEGAILRRDFWRPWLEKDFPPDPTLVIASIDTSYTKDTANDPSACTVWNVYVDPLGNARILMRYAWAKHLEFNELVEQIKETVDFFRVDKLLIEAKASGLSVVQELRRRCIAASIHALPPQGDKVARAHAVTSVLESGCVWVPVQFDEAGVPERDANGDVVWRSWAAVVIDEAAAFPNGAHDDLVDTVTQALRFIRTSGIELYEEDAPPPPPVQERGPLY